MAASSAVGIVTEGEVFRRVDPRGYLRQFLSHGVRADGRLPSHPRKPAVTTGTLRSADGSAMVRLGATSVVCGVRAECVTQTPDGTPLEGRVVAQLDVSPLASPVPAMGRANEDARAKTAWLQKIIDGARMLDLTKMYNEDARAAWVLYADVHCLNDAGSALDAAVLAVAAALADTTLPQLQFSEEHRVVIDSSAPRAPLPLTGRVPASMTFAGFDGATLCDPSRDEEKVAEWSVTVAVEPGCAGDEGVIVALLRSGAGTAREEDIDACVDAAFEHGVSLAALVPVKGVGMDEET